LSANNRGAVAGISPGLSDSETPGLGVAGGIIHFYRVAVAAKQRMGVRQNNEWVCGKTTNGCAAKQRMGVRQNNEWVRGKTTNGWRGEMTNGDAVIRMVFIDADVLPQPLRGNINKLTRYPASPGFRWRSTPGYIPQPLRGWFTLTA
jgi:hypothetical protein